MPARAAIAQRAVAAGRTAARAAPWLPARTEGPQRSPQQQDLVVAHPGHEPPSPLARGYRDCQRPLPRFGASPFAEQQVWQPRRRPVKDTAAAAAGCDVVVVQGIEAGGHVRGHSALLPLLSAVLDVADVPVLAAGGIGDGRALAAVLAAGADGARIGTRFIATTESGAHRDYKRAVLEARAGSTDITSAFDQCALCATSPRARVLRDCIGALAAFPGDTVGAVPEAGQTVPLPRGSGRTPGESFTGCIAAMPMYASDAVSAVVTTEAAGQVVASLCGQAQHQLARLR